MQILLIEDDILWQTKIEMLLSEMDPTWSICTADSIDKANLHLESTIPDMIIADILIGSQTIFRLFDNEICIHIPTVFITISEDEIFYNHSKTFPDSHYLIKPFHKLSLQSAVEKTMLNHKRRLSRNAKGITVRGIHNEKIDLKVHEIVYIESKKKLLYSQNNQNAIRIKNIPNKTARRAISGAHPNTQNLPGQ